MFHLPEMASSGGSYAANFKRSLANPVTLSITWKIPTQLYKSSCSYARGRNLMISYLYFLVSSSNVINPGNLFPSLALSILTKNIHDIDEKCRCLIFSINFQWLVLLLSMWKCVVYRKKKKIRIHEVQGWSKQHLWQTA